VLVEIPIVPGASDQECLVLLDGVRYLLRFRWNDRGQFWAMDIRTEAGAALALGIVLRTGARLLSTRRSAAVPPGDMIVGGPPDESDPTLDSLGTSTHPLIYADAAELAG
jgi:hypothetical protein